MTVYFVNMALIAFWGFVLTHINPTVTKKKIYCVIVTLQWTLVSGLRHESIGADTDGYDRWFERVKTMSWREVLLENWNYLFNGLEVKDPGYDLAQKIFQLFFDDYQMWLIFIAVFFTGLMARWIYKYSTMPDISFIVYSAVFYSFYALTGHRQTLATAIVVFIGYEFVKKKKWLPLVVVTFVAFMLHKSSLIFIAYYVIANITITWGYFFIVMIVTIVITAFGTQLYGPIALALGFGEDTQVFYGGGGAETYATILLLVCITALILYPLIIDMRKDAKYLYNMVFLTIVTTLLVYQNQTFMRIQQYFSLVVMIIIPELIRSIDKRYRVFAYLVIAIILIAYLARNNPQYRFFFA